MYNLTDSNLISKLVLLYKDKLEDSELYVSFIDISGPYFFLFSSIKKRHRSIREIIGVMMQKHICI